MLKNAHIEDPVDSGSGDNQNQVTAYVNSQLSELTGGLSPLMLFMAYQDWIMHLASNPNKQKVLFEKWLDSVSRLSAYNLKSMDSSCGPCVDPPEYDHRFAHSSWSTWPFNMVSQSFLMGERWWDEASKDLRGVSHHHQDVVRFMNRQLLDASSPSNFILTNPEVLNLTLKSGGMNLWMGLQNLVDREERRKSKKPPFGGEAFEVGKQVAITPGKVIYRNRLIELIQYEPTTKQVHPEPILIMPAWIMKYYILDLSPANSLIKYLVDKGHTVFAISWLNPDSEDRDLNLNNYAEFGVMDSLKAINAIVPDQKVHIVGYCIAGTLLSAIAAAMGGNDDHRLASMTLFASQTDFSEVGELSIFIDDAEISFIEDIMSKKGYLDSKHMNGAFQLLNSSDLLWSRILKNYMMGEKQPVNDLAAWNADGTRLPYQMSLLARGVGLAEDARAACDWYRQAADLGVALGEYGLGACYADGDALPRDEAAARAWMHKAAERGLAIAQEQLALMLTRGRGGAVDMAAARQWHRRAAEQGHEPSRLALAALPPG